MAHHDRKEELMRKMEMRGEVTFVTSELEISRVRDYGVYLCYILGG